MQPNDGNHELVEPRNVTMYPQDWSIVDALAQAKGQKTSGALRLIIREWPELKNCQQAHADLETRYRELVIAAQDALDAIDPIAEFAVRARLYAALSHAPTPPATSHQPSLPIDVVPVTP